jgi:hypothetical protein
MRGKPKYARWQRLSFNPGERFESGTQESRKGIFEIEGKVAREATSELGSERVSIEERDFRDRRQSRQGE